MKKILPIFFFILLIELIALSACSQPLTISISGEHTMKAQTSQTLTVAATTTLDASQCQWSSSDETILLVEAGSVTALKEGVASVKVIYKDSVASFSITVTSADKAITYHLNGGTCDHLITTLSTDQVITLPSPQKENATFLGWFDNNNGTGDALATLSYQDNITDVYALWVENSYTITYHLNNNGADETTAIKVAYVDDYFLVDPTFDETFNIFTGWYLDNDYTQSIIYLPKDYNQDIDVYGAIMDSEIRVTLKYETNGGTLVSGKTTSRVNVGFSDFPEATKEGCTFIGWFLDSACTEKAKVIYSSTTLYAKYNEPVPVEFITLRSSVTSLKVNDTLDLTYTLNPTEPTVKSVNWDSSCKDVASIDQDGHLIALGLGTTTITITSESQLHPYASIDITVYDSQDYFEVSYEDNSYCLVGSTITLNAIAHMSGVTNPELGWESLDDTIATVTTDGIVNGMKEGFTYIKCYVLTQPSFSYKFGVTIYDETTSNIIKSVIEAHNSNIFSRLQLRIAGVYNTDIYSSVSNLLFGYTYSINTDYEAQQAALDTNHGGVKPSTDFICVHYTAGTTPGSTAKATAAYFAKGGATTSIHYTTGNDGIYHILDNSLIGFHAGDGHTEDTQEEWYPTGIKYKEGDPIYPTWGISLNSKYTLNGQETIIDVPAGSTAKTAKVTSAKWINKQGFAYKIVDGEYYMGKTWWCYTQVAEGRLCNHGGNLNSIGIESAVNQGSDLWLTWQITAQLCAHLMIEYNLPIQNVVGQHFFSAKNCPQPLLENNLELWWKFIEMVKAEYNKLVNYSTYTYTIEYLGDYNNITDQGRVTGFNELYQTVTYKVTVTDTNGKEQSVILSSIVPGTIDD